MPDTISVETLPDTWYCSQNTWDPSFARCSVREEVEGDVKEGGKGAGLASLATTRDTRSLAAAASAAMNGDRDRSSRGSIEHSSNNRSRRQQPAVSSSGTATGDVKKISWVQCERRSCKKWRKVPAYIDIDSLPEKWYCAMTTWDPDMASCDAPEQSESETEQVKATDSRTQLIQNNSKSSNSLSYRRIIFGTDGRIRGNYSEKNR